MGTFYVVCRHCGADHDATHAHDVLVGTGDPETDRWEPVYGAVCPLTPDLTDYYYGDEVIPR